MFGGQVLPLRDSFFKWCVQGSRPHLLHDPWNMFCHDPFAEETILQRLDIRLVPAFCFCTLVVQELKKGLFGSSQAQMQAWLRKTPQSKHYQVAARAFFFCHCKHECPVCLLDESNCHQFPTTWPLLQSWPDYGEHTHTSARKTESFHHGGLPSSLLPSIAKSPKFQSQATESEVKVIRGHHSINAIQSHGTFWRTAQTNVKLSCLLYSPHMLMD